ncbi:MAG: hypothetical protein HY727_11075 [Candidatus Rokubacteria bacterium]|nr:hypothetical protein [Candidatus Rokubacteria bacterium]
MRALYLLAWVVLAVVVLLPLVRRWWPAAPRAAARSLDELVKDPVCQTYVVRSRALSRQDAGQTRYFCSAECAGRWAAGVGR